MGCEVLRMIEQNLLTADSQDISGDKLAALDTKAEAQPTDVHPELKQFMAVKRMMTLEQLKLEKHLQTTVGQKMIAVSF